MVRWAPGTPERLQQAALELFATQGFDRTTAAEIAEAVGLTERTFFRHFRDKREVLFHGQAQLADAFVAGVRTAPPGAAPMEVVAAVLHSAAEFFSADRRPFSRTRQSVIDQNPALQERERNKLAGLAITVAEEMRARGVAEPAATLAAQSGATVFGLAFAQWIRDGEERSFEEIADDLLRQLRDVAGAVPAGLASRAPE